MRDQVKKNFSWTFGNYTKSRLRSPLRQIFFRSLLLPSENRKKLLLCMSSFNKNCHTVAACYCGYPQFSYSGQFQKLSCLLPDFTVSLHYSGQNSIVWRSVRFNQCLLYQRTLYVDCRDLRKCTLNSTKDNQNFSGMKNKSGFRSQQFCKAVFEHSD